MISALSTILLNTFDIRETVILFGYSFDWKWFTLVAFLFFLGFVAWWIGGLESYKRQMENSKPNLRFKKAGEWQFYTKGQAIYRAIQAWFINNPQVTSNNSVAKDVTAVVSFYDKNTKNKLEIYGCFTRAEVPDYATIKDLKDEIDVWSPNDIPQKLLIAFKYPGDESAYGYAKSNFLATQDGRELGKEIKKGEHNVKVTFKGIGIDQPPFWFKLTNPGQEGDLSLSDQIKKPNLRKEGFQTE